ncbi:hypothetical protein HNV12_07345 [Methanococcoides sp. SA1]|nr:hypothetical protein [Methanococcoides sp. SA1]
MRYIVTFSQILTAYLLVTAVYVYLIFLYRRAKLNKLFHKGFYQSVISVLDANEIDHDCIDQIDLNFRKLSESFPGSSSQVNGPVDLLEEFISKIDSLNYEEIQATYEFEVSKETRSRILNILKIMKDETPFSHLSDKEANILISLRSVMKDESMLFGNIILDQLSEEFVTLNSKIRRQADTIQYSYIIAVVGILLAIYFGIITIIR